MKFRSILLISLLILTSNIHAIAESNSHSYKRIVSLNPILTEEICLLNQGDKLVGVSLHSKSPEYVKKIQKVGTCVQLDAEKVLSLKPDIVISWSLIDPRVKNKLEKLGIHIVVFSYPNTFRELCEQFLKLGILLGEEDQAQEIINATEKKVRNISGSAKKYAPVKVFLQIGSNPLYTINKNFLLNEYIKFANGINIARDAPSCLYSREQVIRQNPDVIIITSMGILTDKEINLWKKYKTLNAVRHNRVYVVDADKVCSPTPVSFAEALGEISGIINEGRESG